MNRNLAVVLVLMLALALLQGCNPGSSSGAATGPSKDAGLSDVEFAKAAFTGLANGNQSIASDIDWTNFKVSGQDVGATYNTFHDDANHEAFRSSFISSFSKSFKGAGGSAEALTNWTETSRFELMIRT